MLSLRIVVADADMVAVLPAPGSAFARPQKRNVTLLFAISIIRLLQIVLANIYINPQRAIPTVAALKPTAAGPSARTGAAGAAATTAMSGVTARLRGTTPQVAGFVAEANLLLSSPHHLSHPARMLTLLKHSLSSRGRFSRSPQRSARFLVWLIVSHSPQIVFMPR
jgi:hypothetical protein